MTKRMRKFIEMIVEDEDLSKKIDACETIDEAFSVAQSFLCDMSYEEFSSGMKELIGCGEKNADEELSDEELESISAGCSAERKAMCY